jgi:ubiquinone/menaquinone biosynthesis C-methylase UbiE
MSTRKFDSNYDALKKRIMINENLGSKDINTWIINHLELRDNQSILDLGCGSGKQLIPIIRLTRNSGKYYGVDISVQAINDLKSKLAEDDLLNHVHLENTDIDNIHALFDSLSFDRILGSYSLYYTKDAFKLLNNLYSLLNNDGILFYCGPSKDNNKELKSFIKDIKINEDESHSFASYFMEETSINIVKNIFTKYETDSFENIITFESADSLYKF